jgi:diguanylate cyclase (GGDEF)-like protein
MRQWGDSTDSSDSNDTLGRLAIALLACTARSRECSSCDIQACGLDASVEFMILRKKILFILSLASIGFIGAVYGITSSILLNSFREVETQDTRQQVERVLSVLDERLTSLESVSLDWSSWDETEAFIKGENPDYIRNNFYDRVFVNFQLNWVLLVQPSGRIAFGQGFDLHRQQPRTLPPTWQQTLPPVLWQGDVLPNSPSKARGLARLPDGWALVIAQPIRAEGSQDPEHGTLIFGQTFDDRFVSQLAKTTHVNLQTYSVDGGQLPADVQKAYSHLSQGQKIWVDPLNADWVAGYTLLHDLEDRPAVILRVEVPRTIYQQGHKSLSYLLLGLLVLSGLFGSVFSAIVRILLKRLEQYVSELFETRELAIEARFDALTQLPNRREFERCLDSAIVFAQQQNHGHILCYLDLDRFKIVNDTCGHAAGDELLRQVAILMQSKVRSTDLLARLGGDEFGLLLYHCPLEQAQAIAENLLAGIQAFRFTWQGEQFSIGVSLGMVSFDRMSIATKYRDRAGLMHAADTACYTAKRDGRNCVRVSQHTDRGIVRTVQRT